MHTCFDEYRKIIFPELSDDEWKHNKRWIVHIPYFIQLTNETIGILFDREVDIPMFDKDTDFRTYFEENVVNKAVRQVPHNECKQ